MGNICPAKHEHKRSNPTIRRNLRHPCCSAPTPVFAPDILRTTTTKGEWAMIAKVVAESQPVISNFTDPSASGEGIRKGSFCAISCRTERIGTTGLCRLTLSTCLKNGGKACLRVESSLRERDECSSIQPAFIRNQLLTPILFLVSVGGG